MKWFVKLRSLFGAHPDKRTRQGSSNGRSVAGEDETRRSCDSVRSAQSFPRSISSFHEPDGSRNVQGVQHCADDNVEPADSPAKAQDSIKSVKPMDQALPPAAPVGQNMKEFAHLQSQPIPANQPTTLVDVVGTEPCGGWEDKLNAVSAAVLQAVPEESVENTTETMISGSVASSKTMAEEGEVAGTAEETESASSNEKSGDTTNATPPQVESQNLNKITPGNATLAAMVDHKEHSSGSHLPVRAAPARPVAPMVPIINKSQDALVHRLWSSAPQPESIKNPKSNLASRFPASQYPASPAPSSTASQFATAPAPALKSSRLGLPTNAAEPSSSDSKAAPPHATFDGPSSSLPRTGSSGKAPAAAPSWLQPIPALAPSQRRSGKGAPSRMGQSSSAWRAGTSGGQQAAAITRTVPGSGASLFVTPLDSSSRSTHPPKPHVDDQAAESSTSKKVHPGVRRLAVYNARGNSVAYDDSKSSERRLPNDGGRPAPRAHKDVAVIQAACEGIALFQRLHFDDRRVLFENMYQLTFNANEYIVTQGDDGRNFYVIVEGSPIVQIKDADGNLQMEKRLNTGDTFGEYALLSSCPRTASVLVGSGEKDRVKVWALDRNSFKKLLSEAAFARRERFTALLGKVQLLASLNEYKKLQLADALVLMHYKGGHKIIQQGVSKGARFHIIESGTVVVTVKEGEEEHEVNQLTVGQYFGEVTLKGDTLPTATVRAQGNVDTLSLDRASFNRLLGSETVQGALEGNMKSYVFQEAKIPEQEDARGTSDGAGPSSSSSQQPPRGIRRVDSAPVKVVYSDVQPQDVLFLEELGLGMSGTAYLCRLPKHNNKHVVIKMMRKARLIRLNQVENVMREKSILMRFNHTFIVNCLGHFQDAHHLYLMMDYMGGGELFRLLNEKQKLSLPLSRFYAAEVLMALEYIHSQGFVYRDLKPENVLIKETGHVRLADMGFCKPLSEGEKTYTTCGTADYMAPEVMLSQGHDKAADFWAFGVLIFEMLAGFAPFEGRSDNERLHRILTGTLVFPEGFNLHARDLVSKLCVVNLSKRYGVMASGIQDIIEHPFFAGLDWFELKNERIMPPHIPKVPMLSRNSLQRVTPPVPKDRLTAEDDKLFIGY